MPALKAGKVSVRPAVRSFTPSEAIYQDDQQEAVDAVIFTTGFLYESNLASQRLAQVIKAAHRS